MEKPSTFQPRDAAFWINVASIVMSSVALTAHGLPNTPESIKFWSATVAGGLELTGVGAFLWDAVPYTISQLRFFRLQEIPSARELICNRRFQNVLLVFINSLLIAQLLRITPYKVKIYIP